MSTVLVTGGTGFLAGHVIVRALQAGHAVRATVRSAKRADGLRAVIGRAVPGATLDVAVADLLDDAGWAAACAGVDAVMHVASPLIATRVEAEVIRPAVDGTLRVLRAARDAGAPRVVMTSSCAAVYYGYPPQTEPFDEASWTRIDGGPMSPYVKSKALAERAAWDFVAREGGGLALSTVCPTGIFGPRLGDDVPSSLQLIERLLAGRPPAVPDLWLSSVDARDVADLHLLALAAPGERFVATAGPPVSMRTIARLLRERLGDRARRVPTLPMPDWVMRLIGRFNVEVHDLTPLLGVQRPVTSAKARDRLGWAPRPWEEAVLASAESLLA